MSGQARFVSDARGWLFATGLGVLAGCLVGSGAMHSYTHAQWPALAGFVLGVAIPLAAPARPVRLAFCGASVAVAAAVAMIASTQLQSGLWPITDEVTVALYGTATQAAMRAAVILGALLGAPCLIAATLVAVARRRYTREDAWPGRSGATGAVTPRARSTPCTAGLPTKLNGDRQHDAGASEPRSTQPRELNPDTPLSVKKVELS